MRAEEDREHNNRENGDGEPDLHLDGANCRSHDLPVKLRCAVTKAAWCGGHVEGGAFEGDTGGNIVRVRAFSERRTARSTPKASGEIGREMHRSHHRSPNARRWGTNGIRPGPELVWCSLWPTLSASACM